MRELSEFAVDPAGQGVRRASRSIAVFPSLAIACLVLGVSLLFPRARARAGPPPTTGSPPPELATESPPAAGVLLAAEENLPIDENPPSPGPTPAAPEPEATPLAVVPAEEGRSLGRAGRFFLAPVSVLAIPFTELHTAGLEGYLEFEYEWDKRRNAFRGGQESDFNRMSYIERLRLLNRWFVFDPRLFSLNTGGTIGFLQENFSSDGNDQTNRASLLGYDLSGTFLQAKPYTLNVFANRGTETLTREFAGSSEILRDRQGATLTVREVIPLNSTLFVRRDKISQDLRFASNFEQREEVRTTSGYTGTWLGEVSDLDLGYEFNDVNDKTFQGLKYQTNEAHLSHSYFFGPYLEKSLSSRLNLFERSGSTNSTHALVDEDLRIDHTDTLSTDYRYNLSFLNTQGFQTVSHSGDIGLQHRLFESLATLLNAQARSTSFQNGGTFGYGGNGDLNYTKKIWWDGRFLGGVDLAYRIEDQEVPSGTLFVTGESHAFPPSQQFFLNNPRVIASSVVVTNEARTEIFQQGFDYVLSAIGEELQVDRIIGGRILEGEPLLVDYEFATAPSLKFATRTNGFNIGLDYNWFLVYLRDSRSVQNLLSGGGSQFLDNVTDDLGGVQLRWSRSWLSADARSEYRDYRSRRLEFTSPSFSQSASLFPTQDASLNLSLDESFFRFSNPERRRSTLTGRVGLFWRPSQFLFVDLRGNYLQFRDDQAPDERFFGGGARVRADFGRLSVSPFLDYNRRDVGSGNSKEVRGGISITRTLF